MNMPTKDSTTEPMLNQVYDEGYEWQAPGESTPAGLCAPNRAMSWTIAIATHVLILTFTLCFSLWLLPSWLPRSPTSAELESSLVPVNCMPTCPNDFARVLKCSLQGH